MGDRGPVAGPGTQPRPLVVNGAFRPAMDAAGARLAQRLAAEHVVLPIGRHDVTLVPELINPLLERLWSGG